jgi:hypothetical protein
MEYKMNLIYYRNSNAISAIEVANASQEITQCNATEALVVSIEGCRELEFSNN